MDQQVPGNVYLCQVNGSVSCGACCGLYNIGDASRDAMHALLDRRARLFAQTPRTLAAIDAFALSVGKEEDQQRPYPRFHHCPFIGLIGSTRSRVGCLLHPLAEGNQGVDWRGLSYYGGLACRTYFCPATHQLPARYKRIVRAVATEWHLYGLVVTEAKLLAGFFSRIEAYLQRRIDAAHFSRQPAASGCLIELLRLKLIWPYRPRVREYALPQFFPRSGICQAGRGL